MKRVIPVSLTVEGIDNAIREVAEFRTRMLNGTKELLRELADAGIRVSAVAFSTATYDGDNDVSCHIEERGEKSIAVVATGNATLFIEFGSGIAYPDSHPEGTATGMVHGSWSDGELGKGHWKNPNGWYYAHGLKSRGNPANMCMYKGERQVEQVFASMAKRVFG